MPFTLGPRAASRGYRVVAFERTGSTNVEAMARAKAGDPGPMWFVTTEQTAGRGRRNRPWIAPRGNLASSILEVMDTTPLVAATLGFAAGLAAQAALRKVSTAALQAGSERPDFLLKWPNDVLAQGKKIVGINLEAETVAGDRLAVVVGIGTNVVGAPEGTPTPAISLSALGVRSTAEEVFLALSDSWAEFHGIWNNGRGFGDIRKLWLAGAVGLGEAVSVRSSNAVAIEGTFETLDEQGCMVVRTTAGNRVLITAGDVHFGLAASARTT
ncbi:MAG TPA: biotin--[acetyl-CoA-carboxylase] ligase [Bradyrhizobium sp.]|nr:biotin--[acetyl-CoA-carboxylase] ligase [Bradyrhizobium sp.]